MNTAQKRKAVGSHAGKTDGQLTHLHRTTLDFNRQVFEAESSVPWWESQVKSLAKQLIPYAFGLSVSLNVALLMVPAEMTRRGYFAIGGEWILVLIAGLVVAKTAKALNKRRA